MSQQFRPLQAEISTENLRHNYRLLKKLAGESNFFCPMIKAYAYGHDDEVTAKTLVDEGCETFGVALIEEGERLRANGIDGATVLVFHPLQDAVGARAMIKSELTPVLSSWREIEILEKAAKRPLAVHVKFNTGMNRLGFEPAEADKLKSFFSAHKILRLGGVCTHFFNSEDWLSSRGQTQKQLERFMPIEKKFRGPKVALHALNSAATVGNFCSETKLALGARPGIALYGVRPQLECETAAQKEKFSRLEFKPVMRLSSKIILTHKLEKGERVSYGGRFVAKKQSLIGVVPVGYADGFFRLFSEKGAMLCDGRRVPVVGVVCMDFTMVDLSELAKAESDFVGRPVTVLGRDGSAEITADSMAEIIGTNSYEILTNVSRRVPRVIV